MEEPPTEKNKVEFHANTQSSGEGRPKAKNIWYIATLHTTIYEGSQKN
jgi:hypothetical protein